MSIHVDAVRLNLTTAMQHAESVARAVAGADIEPATAAEMLRDIDRSITALEAIREQLNENRRCKLNN